MTMKRFFKHLLSDSNTVSTKRVIGLIALIMFIVYGIFGIIYNKELNFWIFYVSLCAVTMWIAFRFMSADKALKYNVLGEMSKFGKLSNDYLYNRVDNFIANENQVDQVIEHDEQPVEQVPPK